MYNASVFESQLHHLLVVLPWTKLLIEEIIKSASRSGLRINWDNVCRALGTHPRRWVCGASAAPCHHGCRAGKCGLKIYQGEWPDTFCLLFYLDCSQKFQPLGFGETIFSLHFQDHSNSQSRERVVLNSYSFPLYKAVSVWPQPAAQAPWEGFQGLGREWEKQREERAAWALLQVGLCA